MENASINNRHHLDYSARLVARARAGSRAARARESTGHSTRHAAGRATGRLVQLGHDRVAQVLELLALVLELLLLGHAVAVEPLHRLLDLVRNFLAIFLADLRLDGLLLDGGFHLEGISFKRVLCRNSVPLLLVLIAVRLGLLHHSLDVLLRQTALVVGDGDLVLLAPDDPKVAGTQVAKGTLLDVNGRVQGLLPSSQCGARKW